MVRGRNDDDQGELLEGKNDFHAEVPVSLVLGKPEGCHARLARCHEQGETDVKVPRCVKCGKVMKVIRAYDRNGEFGMAVRCWDHPSYWEYPYKAMRGWLAVMSKERVT